MAMSHRSFSPAENDSAEPNEAAAFSVASAPIAAPNLRDQGRGGREWSSDDAELLGEVLRSNGLSEKLVERLLALAAAPVHVKRVVDRLAVALGAHFHFLPIEEALREPMLLHGAPGSGISTVAAKLAARFEENQILVVSAGTREPAASAQLEEHLEILGLPLVAAPDAKSLNSILAKTKDRTIVIDSGAVSPETVPSTQRMLVLSAESSIEDATAAANAAAAAGTRRMIVTRLDTSHYLGAVLTAADVGKLALVAASITPHFAFGLRALSPENLARRLMSATVNVDRWRVVPL
jgi:flagellar biosynthesis GTPase FlhF